MTAHAMIVTENHLAFVSTLSGLLMEFNARSSAYEYDGRELAVQLLASDKQTVIGGLLGSTSYGYLHIDALFVPDSLRGIGFGRILVGMAEEEAAKRGCVGVWLDTFSFQSRGFYEKLGYSLFGELPNNPPGHMRYFFKKALRAT